MKTIVSKETKEIEKSNKEVWRAVKLLRSSGLKVIRSDPYGLEFRKFWKDGWWQTSISLEYNVYNSRWIYPCDFEPNENNKNLIKIFEKIVKKEVYIIK